MQRYYDSLDCKLFMGDCIDTLEKATPESIDMIFADPPYHLSNGGFTCHAGKAVSVKKVIGIKVKELMRTLNFTLVRLMLAREF